MSIQALEQTRDSVLRYGESVGCELLNFFVLQRGSRVLKQEGQSRKACRQAGWCAARRVCSCREPIAVANRRIQLNASSRIAGLGPAFPAHDSGSKQGVAKRGQSK